MHGVVGKPAALTNGEVADGTNAATTRTMLLLLVAMTGVAPISLYMLVPALPLPRHELQERHFHRADDGVALHGRHRLLADPDGAALRSLRTPAGIAGGPRPDGGGERGLHLRRDAARN